MRKLLLIAGVAALALPGLAAAQTYSPPQAGDYGADVAYDSGPDGFTAREDRMGAEIRHDGDTMLISDYDAQQDRRLLDRIRQRQADLIADHGRLTPDDRAELNTDLQGLRSHLSLQNGGLH